MGSVIEINDTLQISKQQGFPVELDLEKHIKQPFTAEDFQDRIFEFKDKTGIRFYHVPPVRVFLAENINGKWLYWGLVHIFDINHDYINNTTSGRFKIIYLYNPDEMKVAHDILDRSEKTRFLME